MKYLTIVFLLFSQFVFAESPSQPTAAKELWIDVRTLSEYQESHIKNALHIPYQDIASRIGNVSASKNTVIHLYCARGGRAQKAMDSLERLGYTAVINDGGLSDLIKRGMETEPTSLSK